MWPPQLPVYRPAGLYNVSSVYGPDHHADSFHGVEASTVVGPEDPVLELAAVDASGVPDTVEIGLAASVVPPAPFVEVGTVTCRGGRGSGMIRSLGKCVFSTEGMIPTNTFNVLFR